MRIIEFFLLEMNLKTIFELVELTELTSKHSLLLSK